MQALNQPKNLLPLLSKPEVQNPISKSMVYITMNVKTPIVIYAHLI